MPYDLELLVVRKMDVSTVVSEWLILPRAPSDLRRY